MDSNSVSECPFCGLTESDPYSFLLHVETSHYEGESPFVVRESSQERNDDPTGSRAEGSEDSESDYVDCPEQGCGESILLAELQSHIDLHLAEKVAHDGTEEVQSNDTGRPKNIQDPDSSEAPFSTKLPDALRNRDQLDNTSSSTSRRRQPRHQSHQSSGWRDLLNISSSSRGRSSKLTKASSSSRQRLGVSSP